MRSSCSFSSDECHLLKVSAINFMKTAMIAILDRICNEVETADCPLTNPSCQLVQAVAMLMTYVPRRSDASN